MERERERKTERKQECCEIRREVGQGHGRRKGVMVAAKLLHIV